MTAEQWLKDNPKVTKQQILDELLESRQRVAKYKEMLQQAQRQLAKVRYEALS